MQECHRATKEVTGLGRARQCHETKTQKASVSLLQFFGLTSRQ